MTFWKWFAALFNKHAATQKKLKTSHAGVIKLGTKQTEGLQAASTLF